MEVKVEAVVPADATAAAREPAGKLLQAPPSPSRPEDIFAGLTVGQLLPEGSVGCKLLLHYDLGDAASALHASGRTAAAVAEAGGVVVGLLTENDIMRAFFEGAHVGSKLNEWFDSGLARGSDFDIQRLTVRPSTPLAEVAERMVANATTGHTSCHHVLVEDDDGRLWGVLSALDMVQALVSPDTWDDARPGSSAQKDFWTRGGKAHWTTLGLSVKDVMKSRDDVFTCPPSSTLKDVVKVLLMTGQNSALVVDGHGIYGLVTPRDAVRAFAEGLEPSILASDWLSKLQPAPGPRVVSSDASLSDAAAQMTANKVNHLVVVSPGTQEAVGTLSSLDLALCDKRLPALRARGRGAGPTVGELVSQDWHLTAVCNPGATLREAAALLTTSGRTSTALALEQDKPLRLLTENDLMRAYVFGWEPDATAESWLKAKLTARCSVPEHVLVPPTVRLTEAAFLMLKAAKPGVDACHHLVVKGPKGCEGGWLGVFSALDVARGLTTIGSELEVARTGADRVRVRAAMKTLEALPTCKPTDTLKVAFQVLVDARQNAALVTNADGTHSVLTPRCCLQAIMEDIPSTTPVADFLLLRGGPAMESLREVECDTPLFEVAGIMTERSVHHLVVKDASQKAVGVISSLDLARAVASVQSEQPFASLGWLWAAKGPGACTLW